jgi:hypothetical protein
VKAWYGWLLERWGGFRPAWAVVRIDEYLAGLDIAPEDRVYIKAVWLTRDEAAAEAARLNDLAADKRSRYVVQYTRLARE